MKKWTFNENCSGWLFGAGLLIVYAGLVIFGMQKVYLPVGVALIVLAVSLFRFRKRWCLLTCAALVGLSAFWFTFSPVGYHYLSAFTLCITLLLLIFRYGNRKIRRAALAVSVTGFVLLGIVELPIARNAKTDKDPERDNLLVLGAAVYGTSPSISLTNRLIAADEYLEMYPASIAVLCGGKGEGEAISEAECMYNWLLEKGVPADRLLMEDSSVSTYENIINGIKIIDEHQGNKASVAILSNSYHLFRAKLIAASVGVDAAGVAGVPGSPAYMFGMSLREAFGVVHFLLFGN